MPIVFVHGVNTRHGPAYTAGTLAIQAFLSRHLSGVRIGGKTLKSIDEVHFPYWGDLATQFSWEMASLPRPDMEALGPAADDGVAPLVAHVRDALPVTPGTSLPKEPLTALARKRLSLAVDALAQWLLQSTREGTESATAAFIVQASAYAEAHPSPQWLSRVTTDEQLIAELRAQLEPASGIQAQGGFGRLAQELSLAGLQLKHAVQKMAGTALERTGDFASTKLLAWSRESLNGLIGRFFGDIFVYLSFRGTRRQPGTIPQRVLQSFNAARRSAPADEPFIVIGHSLGGVIAFDLLGHFCPELTVDLFVSVGSPLACFEEMKLYKASDPGIRGPHGRAVTPRNIQRWINVYDEVDIFAYAATRIFDRVNVDARYDTQTYTIKAHSAYLQQDRFYTRLRERVNGLS